MAWLNDNPPARSQFRHPRREEPSGVVAVHTAENTPDVVAFDGGAEAVARFIRDRDTPGSYHVLADSDSALRLVDYMDEAFHDGTGTNPHSFGLSMATRADVWPITPLDWRARTIDNAAREAAAYAKWIKRRRGIVIPALRITAASARLRHPGFVPHADLDPDRRTDPGAGFPWSAFFARYTFHLNPPAPSTPEPRRPEGMSIINIKGTNLNFLHLGGRDFVPLKDDDHFWRLAGAGIPVHTVTNEDFQGSAASKSMLRGATYTP